MTSNMVEKISEAESNADQIVKDAKKKAEEILEQIKTVGKKEYNSIIEEGESARREMLNKAQKEGEIKEAPILEASREKVKKIQNMEDSKIQSVSNSIVERIVSEYVNG